MYVYITLILYRDDCLNNKMKDQSTYLYNEVLKS